MRGSELYCRYIDKITAVAAADPAPAGWETKVESMVKQFHLETMAMARGPFRSLRDTMATELEHRADTHFRPSAREAFSLAAKLVRDL